MTEGTTAIHIPGYTRWILGDLRFDDISVQNKNIIKTQRKVVNPVTDGDIAKVQELGMNPTEISFEAWCTTDTITQKLKKAILSPGQKRLYMRSDRFYYVYGTAIPLSTDAKSPLKRVLACSLIAPDPYEYAHEEKTSTETITASGQEFFLDNENGDVYVYPKWTFTAGEDITDVVITDGINTITYTGSVTNTQILIINDDYTATLEGSDVSGNLSGDLPKILDDQVGEYTISFTSGDAGTLVATYRQRWY